MSLSGKFVKQLIDDGTWSFHSVDDAGPSVGSNSIDIRLSKHILIMLPSDRPILPEQEQDPSQLYYEVELDMDGIVLYPGDFILGSAMERVDCTNPVLTHRPLHSPHVMDSRRYAQHYDGRSTMARIGIQSHVSAGYGDYGFNGAFTLEICNQGTRPVRLLPGMRIGQIYFDEVVGQVDLYDGYTQHDFKPQLPRLGPNRF